MTKNKPKAKEQKAVSRAVKQAGFKNIKEAKEALREANKKAKGCCDKTTSCTNQSYCDTTTYCSPKNTIYPSLNELISCYYGFDSNEGCNVITIKIKY